MPFVSGNLGDGLSWAGEGDTPGGMIDPVGRGTTGTPCAGGKAESATPGSRPDTEDPDYPHLFSTKKTLDIKPVLTCIKVGWTVFP